ncbi:MAG: hypothetical protein PHD43_16855 [Methylococcales bacterium]|nr:hypothetical protein [Methylococcales bacterium]
MYISTRFLSTERGRITRGFCLTNSLAGFVSPKPNPYPLFPYAKLALTASSYLINEVSKPELTKIANDPPDQDFQKVVVPTFPNVPPAMLTGNTQLDSSFTQLNDSMIAAFRFLYAVNVSFDRYSTALSAGDALSSTLQIEAIVHYLSLYDDAVKSTANRWVQIESILTQLGVQDEVLVSSNMK